MKTTCPSCHQDVDSSAGFCPSCGISFSQRTEPLKPIVPQLSRSKIPVDLVVGIDVDRSGSSKCYAAGILKVIRGILEAIGVNFQSVRVWIQTHSDFCYGENVLLVTDGGTIEQAIQESNSIVFAGGGDPPESHLDALEALLKTIPWPTDSRMGRGTIIFITTANTKPTRSGITAKQLGREIKRRGLLLYLICEPFPFHYDLAREAEGLILAISNNPDPAELQAIAAQLSASVVATVSSGATTPMTI